MPSAASQDRVPLTFTFKNIGPVENADLELGDLTIVAGRNNTGKTYLVYTLYGFLTTWEDWPGPALRSRKARAAERSRRSERYPTFEQINEQVEENGQAEVLVDHAALSRERREAIAALTRRFSEDGSDLYFFLRHVARRNHLLIIDEPESHLDTANQVLLARLLARLIQAGLKVLLTTHSDYLIKELNNLIMLSRSFRNKSKVMRKLKYSRDDHIVPERIRAYVAADGGVARCEIDKLGIDMPNFDQTINEINDVANELAIRVSEDSTD